MSKGSKIIVGPGNDPHGRFWEGLIGTGLTIKPGMACQIDVSESQSSGKWVMEYYNADASGGRPKGPLFVCTEHNLRLQGKTIEDSYVAGELASFYVPLPGDELNLLLLNIAGTADDHVVGEVLIPDDTTGKWIATASTPEIEPAMLLEAVTDPTADTLAHAIWTGY